MEFIQKCITVYGNVTLETLIEYIKNANYINIYTDGSTQYKNNQRQSGIGVYFGDDDERNVSKIVNTIDNNECELLACIEALSIVQYKYNYVTIFTDSRLVVDGMNGQCTKTKFDLFTRLEELTLSFIDVKFIYVKGHSGIEGNEKADTLSRSPFNS